MTKQDWPDRFHNKFSDELMGYELRGTAEDAINFMQEEIEKAEKRGAIEALEKIKKDVAVFEWIMGGEMEEQVKEYIEEELKKLKS